MSTLSVDTIQGKTTAGTVAMPAGHVFKQQVVQQTSANTQIVLVAMETVVTASYYTKI